MDDTQNVTFFLLSDQPVQQTSWKREHVGIIVRFKRGKLDAYLKFDTMLGMGRCDTMVRWDKTPARREAWSTSTDMLGLFPLSESNFIKRLTQHSRLVLEVAPPVGNTMLVEFTVTGFNQTIASFPAVKQAVEGKAKR